MSITVSTPQTAADDQQPQGQSNTAQSANHATATQRAQALAPKSARTVKSKAATQPSDAKRRGSSKSKTSSTKKKLTAGYDVSDLNQVETIAQLDDTEEMMDDHAFGAGLRLEAIDLLVANAAHDTPVFSHADDALAQTFTNTFAEPGTDLTGLEDLGDLDGLDNLNGFNGLNNLDSLDSSDRPDKPDGLNNQKPLKGRGNRSTLNNQQTARQSRTAQSTLRHNTANTRNTNTSHMTQRNTVNQPQSQEPAEPIIKAVQSLPNVKSLSEFADNTRSIMSKYRQARKNDPNSGKRRMIDPHSPATHNTRRTILQTARRLFFQEGYHNVGIRRLAQESGITSGALYLYFDNKEAILNELIQPQIDAFWSIVKTSFRVYLNDVTDPKRVNDFATFLNEPPSVQWVFELIAENPEEWDFILHHSEGTQYANFAEEFSEFETKCAWQLVQIFREYNEAAAKMTYKQVQVIISSMITMYLRSAEPNLDPETREACFSYCAQIFGTFWKTIFSYTAK